MLRRPNSSRTSVGKVDFSEYVHQICYGDCSDLEEELIRLVAEDEEKDTNSVRKDANGVSNVPVIRKPKLVDCASQGATDGPDKHDDPGTLKGNMTKTSSPNQSHIGLPDQANARQSRTKRVVDLLNQRQRELRLAAYQARQVDELEMATRHARAANIVASVMRAVQMGETVDPKQLPQKPNLNVEFNGPVLSTEPCEPPALLRLDLEHAADLEKQEQIFVSLLKSQIAEAKHLSQKQSLINSTKTKNELDELASVSESTISKLKEEHECLLPQFRMATLPIVNKNVDVKDGIVEVALDWGIKACALSSSEALGLSATQIQIEFPYPSESNNQTRFTVKAPFLDRYSRGHSVQELRINRANWFVRRMGYIRLHIFIWDLKEQKNRGRLLKTVKVPLQGLEQLATVNSTHVLENRCGVVEVTLRQRISTSGCCVTTRSKPWLCITVVPAASKKQANSYPNTEALANVKHLSKIPPNSPTLCDNCTRSSISIHHVPQPNIPQNGFPTPIEKLTHNSVQIERHSTTDISAPKSTLQTVNGFQVKQIYEKPKAAETNGQISTVQRVAQPRPASLMTTPSAGGPPVRPELMQSRALLESQARCFESRVVDAGLTEAARQNYMNQLGQTRRLIATIDQRLSGPNAALERKKYLAGLEQLVSRFKQLSLEAKQRNDLPQWTGYQHKIMIVTEELKSFK